ncbi:MAG: hypothetical protein WBW08_04335 [Methyloceanibacter sp.]|jgi:hypothetical protein
MRTLALFALASLSAFGVSLPAAAQTEPAGTEPPRSISVPKQAMATAPERLAPPQPLPAEQAPVQPQAAPTLPRPMPAFLGPEQMPSPAPQPLAAFSTPERLMEWMLTYRQHRNPSRVPEAVHAMTNFRLFDDEEKAGYCTGFIAGVLGDNSKAGPALVARMFPIPDKQQAVIIRAIAYSGRPDWRELLQKFRDRMPLRQPLIESYLSGQAPTLMERDLSDGSPVVYMLWGYYVATGHYEPVVRIMQALRWSRNKEDHSFSWGKMFDGWSSDPSAVDKITTGGTAKWTLASYAERNRDLLDLYRAEYDRQPEDVARPLKEVIEAAEVFESERVRKDQFGAIEDAQKMRATNEAGMSKAATAGSIAIATGCVAASALGQLYIAVPCVIGGALYTGAVKLMH